MACLMLASVAGCAGGGETSSAGGQTKASGEAVSTETAATIAPDNTQPEGTGTAGTQGPGGQTARPVTPGVHKTTSKGQTNKPGTPTQAPPKDNYDYKASKVADTANLKYHYDGSNYRFAIDKKGNEYIAYYDKAAGTFVDIFGGDEYYLNDESGMLITYTGDFKGYRKVTVDGCSGVEINYDAPAGTIRTTYKFAPDYVGVTAKLQYAGTSRTGTDNSYLNRDLINPASAYTTKSLGKWVFSDDAPYRALDAFVTVHTIGSYQAYTFIRDNPASSNFALANFASTQIPMKTAGSNALTYSIKMDIRLDRVNSSTDNIVDAQAIVNDQPLSYKLVPKTKDKAMVFDTDAVDFDVTVKNVSAKAQTASIAYNVMNYYNQEVLKKSENLGTLAAGASKKAGIHVAPPKKGMHFLTMNVTGGGKTLKDYYTFAMTPKMALQYKKTNPFGLCMNGMGGASVYNDVGVEAMKKIGVAKTRTGMYPSYDNTSENQAAQKKLMKDLTDAGIVLNAIQLYWGLPNDAQEYEKITREYFPLTNPYAACVEIGNEEGLAGREMNPQYGNFDQYLNKCFLPAYKAIKALNPNMKIMNGALSGGDTGWMQLMKDTGMWDKIDYLSYHPYGIPYAPDSQYGGFWNIEKAMKDVSAMNQKLGAKPLYITETGYPTTPLGKAKDSLDLRTQGDYLLRCYALGMSYGAKVIEWYSIFDKTGADTFDDTYMEYHFGLFYLPDANGLLMPKPSAMAFATMARVLDGTQSTREVTVRSKLRVFEVTLKGKTVAMAWSTKERHALDAEYGTTQRKPSQAWENVWKQTDNVTFQAAGSQVTVIDAMGNETIYKAAGGKVTIPMSGSTVFIEGLKL